MDYSSLGHHVRDAYVFRGTESKPFLAPRGVWVAGDVLLVSDTGQNRVFGWRAMPQGEFQDPDFVLGQDSVTGAGRNAGDAVSATSLHYPSGVWSDGQKLVVADAWNHRVLIWHEMPQKHGQAADVVLGQPDFESNEVNVTGIGADPTASSLHWPYGVFSDGKGLWIADTGNRRVLYFEEIPTDNFVAADAVIGKPNFTTRDYEHEDAIWPYSVKISPEGAMAIADTQFYRVLLWTDCKKAFAQKADVIIGQNSFDDCGQNQFGLVPNAHCLNWVYDSCFYKKGILVNDTGNSRILGFDELPDANNAAADWLIGRPDFATSSEYKGNMMGTQEAIYWPFSVATQGDQIYIADTGNHRLVIGKL